MKIAIVIVSRAVIEGSELPNRSLRLSVYNNRGKRSILPSEYVQCME